jgi:hypothetical protein
MKIILLLLITAIIISSCKNEERKIYSAIDLATYQKFKPLDTLYSKVDYLVTKCKDTLHYLNAYVTLIRKATAADFKYYILNRDAFFENDSSIVAYDMPLKSYSGTSEVFKDEIWFYATFYTEKKDSTSFIQSSVSGINYRIDSMPPNLKPIEHLPAAEGIYFYAKDSLVRISTEQSEEKFYDFHTNGFYFLPAPGRFFKRYSIRSIQ